MEHGINLWGEEVGAMVLDWNQCSARPVELLMRGGLVVRETIESPMTMA